MPFFVLFVLHVSFCVSCLVCQELLTTTMAQLEGFALEGLRTLMLGCKDMSEEEYARWDEV